MDPSRWSFEDDYATTVELDRRPTRILAYAQAASTLVGLGVPVAGYFGSQHHAESGAGGPAALDGVPSVGAGADVDDDRVAALRPELIVGVSYGGETYGVSAEVAARLAETAPVLLMQVAGGRPLTDVIGRFEALAGALAAGTGGPDGELAAATERLGRAAAGSTARVLALSGGTDAEAYVANPTFWSDLLHLSAAGVRLGGTGGGAWTVVGWDSLAADHPADLLLYDRRANSLGPDRLAAIPAWADLPAVRAGRVLPWDPEPVLTTAAAAAFVDTVADALA
jgi:iron-desferrioxamine transport system substrate-binding protein